MTYREYKNIESMLRSEDSELILLGINILINKTKFINNISSISFKSAEAYKRFTETKNYELSVEIFKFRLDYDEILCITEVNIKWNDGSRDIEECTSIYNKALEFINNEKRNFLEYCYDAEIR